MSQSRELMQQNKAQQAAVIAVAQEAKQHQ